LNQALFDTLSLRGTSWVFTKKKPCEGIDENVIELYHQAHNQLGTPWGAKIFLKGVQLF